METVYIKIYQGEFWMGLINYFFTGLSGESIELLHKLNLYLKKTHLE